MKDINDPIEFDVPGDSSAEQKPSARELLNQTEQFERWLDGPIRPVSMELALGWDAYEGSWWEMLGLIVLMTLCTIGLGSVIEKVIDKWVGGKK